MICPRSLLIIHLKAIADAVNGLDVGAGIRKLFPKLLDQRIYGTDISLIVVSPDGIQNGLTGEDQILVLYKIEKKRKFLWCKI